MEAGEDLRAEVLAALRRTIGAQSWYVVLWSAVKGFAAEVARQVLNTGPVRGLSPWSIANMTVPALETALSEVERESGDLAFKIGLARILKRLDALLGEHVSAEEPWGPFPGLDGRSMYWIAGRVDPGSRVSERDQGAGLSPFTQLLRAVPCRIDDVNVELRRPTGVIAVALSMGAAQHATGHGALRLMAGTPTRVFEGAKRSIPNRRDIVKMAAPTNDAAVQRQLLALVKRARRARVSALVLPELSVSLSSRAAIASFLAGEPGFPMLTSFGMVHEEEPAQKGGVTFRNVGIVLGPDGAEVLRHEKLTTVAVHSRELHADEQNAYLNEATAIGSRFEMLLTPFGWVACVVCLDLFHSRGRKVLDAAGARLLLVPSLSDKVSPHERSAGLLRALGTISVVANRPLTIDPGKLRASLDRAPHIIGSACCRDGHVTIRVV